MTLKSLLTAAAVLLGATTMSLAQSQPNCGPNAPGVGDTYGKPFSGTLAARQGADRCQGYIWRHSHRYYRRHWHWYD